MGVDIRLTDHQFPASPGFIDFLYREIRGDRAPANWHDQISEKLVPAEHERRVEQARSVADAVLAHPLGQRGILRAYEFFTAFLTGDEKPLREFHRRFRFAVVVGCPRHGGSYLTKALFRALGHVPDQVPDFIAHDGFPDSSPFGDFGQGFNSFSQMQFQAAEYLAMVEIFFGDNPRHDGKIVVPKKATKAAYNGGFFSLLFGEDAEYLITLRHPLAACISTYEKSGGLPALGRFARRGNIEHWAWRDLGVMGVAPAEAEQIGYFDAYLGYWTYYHRQLADTGLAACRDRWQVVAYGRERLMSLADGLNRRYGGKADAEDFFVSSKVDRHPDWQEAAATALRHLGATWKSRGLPFPSDALDEAW